MAQGWRCGSGSLIGVTEGVAVGRRDCAEGFEPETRAFAKGAHLLSVDLEFGSLREGVLALG